MSINENPYNEINKRGSWFQKNISVFPMNIFPHLEESSMWNPNQKKNTRPNSMTA